MTRKVKVFGEIVLPAPPDKKVVRLPPTEERREFLRQQSANKRMATLAHREHIIMRFLYRATNPLRAIRAKCVQCKDADVRAIHYCKESQCALWPYRMECNPYRKGAKRES